MYIENAILETVWFPEQAFPSSPYPSSKLSAFFSTQAVCMLINQHHFYRVHIHSPQRFVDFMDAIILHCFLNLSPLTF